MRRFALTNLRDFGMGKKGAEEKIIDECHHLKTVFEKYEGKRKTSTQVMQSYFAMINVNLFYNNNIADKGLQRPQE